MIELTLRIEYGDEGTARAVLDAVSPDNGGYVTAELQGRTLVMRMSADGAGPLRNTADDLMACVKAAEEASGLVAGPAPDLDGDPFLE
ncbi:MAG: hypothetical protein FWH47_07870 [Methanomassiliicoccaceae archaeon]|nr:hypothetical protein [Methanomassiliicoccaceae archaeon]